MLSMKKWFQNMPRTVLDAQLDELYPHRTEADHPDQDTDSHGGSISVDCPIRCMKEGYWGIPSNCLADVVAAIEEDEEKFRDLT
jgi:hypothetical protein